MAAQPYPSAIVVICPRHTLDRPTWRPTTNHALIRVSKTRTIWWMLHFYGRQKTNEIKSRNPGQLAIAIVFFIFVRNFTLTGGISRRRAPSPGSIGADSRAACRPTSSGLCRGCARTWCSAAESAATAAGGPGSGNRPTCLAAPAALAAPVRFVPPTGCFGYPDKAGPGAGIRQPSRRQSSMWTCSWRRLECNWVNGNFWTK